MNKTISESLDFIHALVNGKFDLKNKEVIIFPPFTTLFPAIKSIRQTFLQIGSQNVHYEKNGEFTGEISYEMLKELNINHVLVGHSERRHIFGETNEFLNKKLKTLLENGFIPFYCIGETLEERENGKTFEILKIQIDEGLKDIGLKSADQIVIAYEPVWAIGTGKTPTTEQAEEIHKFIRNLIKEKYGGKIANEIRIIYGGSIKPSNFADIISCKNIDGGLIGGSSLDIESFLKLVETPIPKDKEGAED